MTHGARTFTGRGRGEGVDSLSIHRSTKGSFNNRVVSAGMYKIFNRSCLITPPGQSAAPLTVAYLAIFADDESASGRIHPSSCLPGPHLINGIANYTHLTPLSESVLTAITYLYA